MKRPFRRATGAFMIALALLVLTGTALADSGNGNGNSANAPGQVKQADATPASQPAQPSSQAPGQEKKATTSSSTPAPSSSKPSSSPGQAKQQAKAATSTPGVKPSNTTSHSTSCSTGMSGTSVTCAGNGPKADGSKQYGNGKTAAQIATGNGAPANTPITGPGNSQPHKVTTCQHTHAVDVHAIKSGGYDASACQSTQLQPSVQTSSSSVCGQTTIVTQSTQVLGVMHGKSPHLMTNQKSAHFTKHHDTQVLGTTSSTQVVPTGESCSSTQSSQQTQQTQQSQQTQQTQQSAVSTQTAAAQSQDAVAGQSASTSPTTAQATPATGGVLGATANLNTPKPQHRGGVLGAVTNVAGSTLPFTGFPLWIAALLAVALIGSGLALRGRSSASRI
jgi:hypothetical protein